MTTQLELIRPLDEIKNEWLEIANARWKLSGLYFEFQLPEIFTADDVRAFLPEPAVANWMGCFLAQLKNTGRIEWAGRVKSTRLSRNGAKIDSWRRK